jgi:hypothetical protein
MKPFAAACLTAAISTQATVFAEDVVVGTYSGSYTFPGPVGDTPLGVKLVITDVDGDGVVKGRVELNSRGPCAGDYPMLGKLQEKKLVMRSTEKRGRAGDCSFSFNVVADGNKLIGTTGTSGTGRPLQLSR